MVLNESAYIRMLRALLPRGTAWESREGSNFNKLLQALADEMLRVDQAIAGAIDEADPQTTTDLLEEWERIVGIPDTCTGTVATTPAGRRAEIVARLAARGGQTKEFFIELAADLGVTITIEEYRRFLAGRGRAGDPVSNQWEWSYIWRVKANIANGTDLSTTLECLINRHKPAHTVVYYSYI